jgi:hypothetical protein
MLYPLSYRRVRAIVRSDRAVADSLMPRSLSTLSLVLVTGAIAVAPVPAARAQRAAPVSLSVQFKLTDLDYHPIAGAPARIVFGSDPDWQGAASGSRCTTSAAGECAFTASAVIDKREKKLPTNYIDSLFSRPRTTDHLTVAAELGYMTFQWLYVIDLYRFPQGGDVIVEPMSVYTRDEHSRFTRKAAQVNGGWMMADLKGMALTTPGHDVYDSMLEPLPQDSTRQRWALRLSFKRYAPPMVR